MDFLRNSSAYPVFYKTLRFSGLTGGGMSETFQVSCSN